MAEPTRRTGLPPELGVAALVVAASLPLGRLFRTSEISAVAFSAAVAGTAVAWGLRRVRAPALVSALVSFAAFLWFASLAFFRDALWGPLPSPQALSMIWDAAVDGIRRSQTDAAPVPATTPFLCLASFGIWSSAWLADDAANKLRHPMLAIGVTVPLFVLPGTIIEGDRRWFDAGAYLAAAMWVLFADERFRLSRWGRVVGLGSPGWRPGLAARIGLIAILLAVIGTPIVPGFSAPPGLRGTTGGGDRVAFNPLVSIKPTLTDRRISQVMTVRSRIPTYWRLTALDQFTGDEWTSGRQDPTLPIGERQLAAQSTSPRFSLVSQQVEIQNLAGPWVPAAFEPLRIEGLRGVGADPATRTIIVRNELRPGTSYTVRSRLPVLSFEELDLAPPVSDPFFERYLRLPRTPEMLRVEQIAQGIVRSAKAENGSPMRRAVALQNHLRTFEYDEQVALRHSIDNLATFLVEIRRGYCEQFAASMAVMARALGLPSRVAIGFAVGTQGTEPDEWEVTSRHAHAWVEIWMSGFGWVTFEPTPRSDAVQVPGYTSPQSAPVAPTAEPTTTPEDTPSATPTAGSTRAFEPPDAFGDIGTPASTRLIQLGVVLAGGLGFAMLVLPVAARVRRSLRYRRATTSPGKVSARYLDFLDWCASVGLGRRSGETPREHARRLAKASTDATPTLDGLARLGTDAVYAATEGLDPHAAARLSREARRSIGPSLTRRTRMLSMLGWAWWRTDPESGGLSLVRGRGAESES